MCVIQRVNGARDILCGDSAGLYEAQLNSLGAPWRSNMGDDPCLCLFILKLLFILKVDKYCLRVAHPCITLLFIMCPMANRVFCLLISAIGLTISLQRNAIANPPGDSISLQRNAKG